MQDQRNLDRFGALVQRYLVSGLALTALNLALMLTDNLTDPGP